MVEQGRVITEPNGNSVRKVKVGNDFGNQVSAKLLFFIFPWRLRDSQDSNCLSADESQVIIFSQDPF